MPIQFPLQSTDKFAIVGRSGCGKTTMSRYIQSHYARSVIFDTLEEYNDGIIVHTFDQFARIARLNESSPKFRIIYRMDITRDNETEFHHAMHALYEWGNLQIVIEEVQELAGTHSMPAMLKRAILTGRHAGISILCTTQRPGELHKTILSQAGHVLSGQLHDRNDVNYVSGFLGKQADELVNLPPYQFLWFRPGQGISQVTLQGNSLKIVDKLPISTKTDKVTTQPITQENDPCLPSNTLP